MLFLLSALLQIQGSGSGGEIIDTDQYPEPPVYGQIPDSLLERKADHSYPYEYLLNHVAVRFHETEQEIVAEYHYHHRMKVYSDDPADWAEVSLRSIPYYPHEGVETVSHVEGMTHHQDGSVAVLPETEILSAELGSGYRVTEFIMPEVEQGVVVEYRYVIRRTYIDELREFYLSEQVPTLLAHVAIHNEDYIRYDAVASNLDFHVQYHEQETDTSDVPKVFTYRRPDPVSVEHWFAEEIPAVKQESYISSYDDLRGRLSFQISEFGRPRQPLLNSWEFAIAHFRRSGSDPFQAMEDLEEYRQMGREFSEHNRPNEHVRDSIFFYVNRNMEFNGEHRLVTDLSPAQVLEGEPSDQAAINLVLMAMLDGAGLEPYPVLLSGRNYGKVNREFASVYQFNQLIIATESSSGITLMDASYSNSRPGMISPESVSDRGLMMRQENFEWIRIQPEYAFYDLDVDLSADLSEEGELSGSIRILTGGYPAREVRQELSNQRSPDRVIQSLFFDSWPDIQISRAEIRETDSGSYPLLLTADFRIPHYAFSFREGLQFRPMVVGQLEEQPFQEQDRVAPVRLDAPEFHHIRYEIRLPEEYMQEELRHSGSTKMDGAELHEEYQTSGSRLHYTFRVDIPRQEFTSEEYKDLQELYTRWVSLSQEEWFIERKQ